MKNEKEIKRDEWSLICKFYDDEDVIPDDLETTLALEGKDFMVTFHQHCKDTDTALTVLFDKVTYSVLSLVGDWRREIDDIPAKTYEKCLRLFRENYPDFGGPLY